MGRYVRGLSTHRVNSAVDGAGCKFRSSAVSALIDGSGSENEWAVQM